MSTTEFNPLSSYWSSQSPPSPICYPALYVLGMVGYAGALIVRIGYLVKELFHLVGAFFYNLCVHHGEGFQGAMNARLCALGVAAGGTCSAVVGILCPPLAYALDRALYDRASAPPAPTAGQTVEHPLDSFTPHLKSATGELALYFTRGDLREVYATTIKQVFLIALLQAWEKPELTSIFKPIKPYLARQPVKFDAQQRAFDAQRATILRDSSVNTSDMVEWLIAQAVLKALVVDGLGLDKDAFLAGQEETLDSALGDEYRFDELYNVLERTVETIMAIDRGLCAWVYRASGLEQC
ncbi:MAG: hypothetical protein S4CHLAM2_14550 [Chlamydiales bacterium]|nr:hypothetical protein [Chlamydiales bacterium]